MEEVKNYFPMKALSIGTPNIYLGSRVKRGQLTNVVESYAINMSQYIQRAIKNV